MCNPRRTIASIGQHASDALEFNCKLGVRRVPLAVMAGRTVLVERVVDMYRVRKAMHTNKLVLHVDYEHLWDAAES